MEFLKNKCHFGSTCLYGLRCRYGHSPNDINNFKKRAKIPCIHALRGVCIHGKKCAWSHDPYKLNKVKEKQTKRLAKKESKQDKKYTIKQINDTNDFKKIFESSAVVTLPLDSKKPASEKQVEIKLVEQNGVRFHTHILGFGDNMKLQMKLNKASSFIEKKNIIKMLRPCYRVPGTEFEIIQMLHAEMEFIRGTEFKDKYPNMLTGCNGNCTTDYNCLKCGWSNHNM
jgi:hypothetical protein